MCNSVSTITSERQTQECIPINKAVVSGTIAIGIGYTQLAEFSASLDVPCMSPKIYTKYSDQSLFLVHFATTLFYYFFLHI